MSRSGIRGFADRMDFPSMGRKANALLREGRLAEAEEICRSILDTAPGHAAARYTLGTILLSRGEDEEGWRLREARLELPETGIRPPPVRYPRWTGQAVSRLLVLGEQGHGDQIMFARYLPLLVERGIEVTLLCRPGLVRLFSPFGCTIHAMAGSLDLPPHDAWSFIGSLPAYLGFIAPTSYLPSRAGGSGVGVMTAGDPTFSNNSARSLPSEFGRQLLACGRDLSPEATGARDFQDTADVIADLELVITVDTAVAHLAGAMGKPTWLLLPRPAEWRWGLEGNSTRWYPSIRLFRQEHAGDWAGVLAQVRRGLPLTRPAAAAGEQ